VSYSEKDGQVLLTMSRDDYDTLLFAFGWAAGSALRDKDRGRLNRMLQVINRVNEGNPEYRPYQVNPSPNCTSNGHSHSNPGRTA
jgi:hypothetical protein